jgi:tetratricopeptide (TPR) repeat protein
MRVWIRFAVLALCLAAAPALAVSDDVKSYLNVATQNFENLQYEKALAQLKKARGKAQGAEDEKVISLYEGVVLAEMGKMDKAEAAFKTALSMDLKVKLPFEVSPKVEKAFEKARANVEKLLGPQLAREEEERKKKEAEEARLAEEKRKKDEADKAEQERLARENAPPTPPLVSDKPTETAVKTTTGGAARRLFWIPGVVGLGLAAGGTVSLLQARYNYDRLVGGQLSGPDALTARDTGKSQQTVGWVLVGAGGAAVVASVAMLIFGGPTETAAAPAPTASLVPIEGGGVMVVSGSLP